MPEIRQPGKLYLALALLIFSALLLAWLIPNYVSYLDIGGSDLSPRFMPYLITITLAVLSSALAFSALRAAPPENGESAGRSVSYTAVWGAALFYSYFIAIYIIGMLPASFIALIVLMRVFGLSKWWQIIAFSICFSLSMFVFFEYVANVPMPRGRLFDGLY